MLIEKLFPRSAALILAGLVLLSFARADDPAEKAKADPSDSIRQALKNKVNWDFNEMPLAENVAYLADELKIPVRLDVKAINELGVAPDAPVSFKLSGVSAKTALKHLLRDLGLTIYIDGEVLAITSPDVADCNLTTVLYNVSDLPAFRRPNGKTAPNYERLIAVVAKTIKPTTWDAFGGPGSILEYDAGDVQALVVSQTWEVHEEIRELLDGLRKLKPGPLSREEIESLPPEPSPKAKSPSPPASPSGGGPMGGGMGGVFGPGGMGGATGGTPAGGMPGTAAPNQKPAGRGAF
ncbi:MAG: hypothetical protein IT426_18260 [Pirellulales bacterium]|nr:hypothetical protein [Pirellulales bacterium]